MVFDYPGPACSTLVGMYKVLAFPRRGRRAARPNWLSAIAIVAITLLPLNALWATGTADEETTEGEAMSEREKARAEILAKTTERHGCQEFDLGKVGATWLTSINNDPKSFRYCILFVSKEFSQKV